MRLPLSLLGAVVIALGVGCSEGDQGPQGPPGDGGPPGPGGDAGSSCTQPGGLSAVVAVSSPVNGAFFLVGDRPVVTITFTDPCGQTVPPASLGSTADFFVVGPRSPLQTVTAYNLLNLTPAPFTAQGLKPLADGGLPNANLTVQPDGTVVYTLNPITTEAPGTYTAAVWAIGPDPLNQMFVLQDFQNRDGDGRAPRQRNRRTTRPARAATATSPRVARRTWRHRAGLLAGGQLRARLAAHRQLQGLPQQRRVQPQSPAAKNPRRPPRRAPSSRRAPRIRSTALPPMTPSPRSSTSASR